MAGYETPTRYDRDRPRLRVRWIHKKREGWIFDLGYAATNRELYEWGARAGIVDDPDAPIALHCCSPKMFRPVRGRKNIVITMWESPDFRFENRPYLDAADAIIVPTTFVRDEIFRLVLPDMTYHVVPLGVDPNIFTRKRRVWNPGEEFQWLNVGAPNARKGWDIIEEVWNLGFHERTDCSLYCKTTGDWIAAKPAMFEDGWKEYYPGVFYRRNVVLDYRKLPLEALVETMHRSNGFVYPTAGEGFGLTLLEAMATSLPCITTRYSGVLDFTDDTTVKYVGWKPLMAEFVGTDGAKGVINSAFADIRETRDAMLAIMADYHRALKMGRRAARKAREFTWENAGQALYNVLAQYAA